MNMIVMLVVRFASVSLRAATNELTLVNQAITNTIPVKFVKSAKQVHAQCEAITLSGNRCKRRAVVGSRYCRQHDVIMRKRSEAKEKNHDK